MKEKSEKKWTKLEDVERAISRFLTEKSFPESVVLSGNWGVGKTFLWNKIVEASPKFARPKYAYVSLFGVANLNDLKYSIFEAIDDWPDTGSVEGEPDLKSSKDKSEKRFRGLFGKDKLDQLTGSERGLVGKVGAFKDLPWVKQFEPLIRSLAFNSVIDAIVCIDDFERRGQGLRPVDVLGLASYLRESRNCKVILIHNEDALESDKEEFHRFEEKVFDWRIVLDPKPEFSVECIVPAKDEFLKVWMKFARLIGANNIRIIRRAYEQVNIVRDYFPDAHPEIREQFVSSLLLFNFAKFGNMQHIPSLKYLRRSSADYFSSDDEPSAKEKLWQETLNALDWYSTDEVDIELMELVEKGYVSLKDFQIEIDRKTKFLEDANAKQELDVAWGLYHATFKNNEKELAEAVNSAVSGHLDVLSPMNVSQSIILLRDLGKDAEANAIADAYVVHHKGNATILDVESSAFGDEIRDHYLLGKMSDALLDVPDEKDLEEILERLARDKGWGGSDEEYLSNLTEEFYHDFFVNYDGTKMSTLLKGATTFARISNSTDRIKDISRKIRGALETVAATSLLNERRLKRFGISPKPRKAKAKKKAKKTAKKTAKTKAKKTAKTKAKKTAAAK